MKAVLNVEGKQLEVTNIYYVNGEVRSVQVHLGENEYRTYDHHESVFFNDAHNLIDFSKSLEFPQVKQLIDEENNKLIDHLDEALRVEDEKLINIAVDAMESDADGLPFVSTSLANYQKEYKLNQQRVLGMIDAIEEVKAYTEGYYADKNNDEPVEEEKYHQSIE